MMGGNVIGMLCINMDMEKISMLKSLLDEFMSFEDEKQQSEQISETFSQSAKELTLGQHIQGSCGIWHTT